MYILLLALKTIKLSTPINYQLVHDSRSACIDPEVIRLKVKVTRLSDVLPATGVGMHVDMTVSVF